MLREKASEALEEQGQDLVDVDDDQGTIRSYGEGVRQGRRFG